jgi:tetratricopeptide (TPR) repeat protein
MDDHTDPDFQMRITELVHEGKWSLAIDEIIGAIRDAEKLKTEEKVCYLYSRLAGIYFVQEKVQDALAVLEECETKYPNSVLAKFVYLENLFWHARKYDKVIQKAEAIIALVQLHVNYYHKSLYLKGLAHVELGQFREAIEMLKETNYYDLTLVEKLINHRVGITECREFLFRASNAFKAFQMRGEDVGASIRKIESLMTQLDRMGGKNKGEEA